MRWLLGGLLVAGFLLWWPTAGSPHVLRWLAIGLLGGLCLYAAVERGYRPTLPFLASLVLLGWLTLSLAWSPDPRHGALSLLQIAALWCVFWGAGAVRNILAPAAMLGICIALPMLVVFPEAWGGFGNGNWAAAWLMLALPIAATWCWGLRTVLPIVVTLGVLLLAVVWVVFQSGSDSWLPVVWVCALAWLVSQRWYWSTAMAIVIPLIVVLWWRPESIFVAAQRRMELWINTAEMWLDAPWFGHGLGSFNYVYDRFREAHARWMPDYETHLHPLTVSAGEAHNEPLQLLSEAGLVGLILAGVFLWSVVRQRVDEPLARSCKWTLLIAGVLSLISSPLQNPATALLVAVLLGLVAGSPYWRVSSLRAASPASTSPPYKARAF